MAPIPSDDESDVNGSSVSISDAERVPAQTNGLPNGELEDDEEEFHTEDSEGSDDGAHVDDEAEEYESDIDTTTKAPGIPLLPESLLKQLPRSAAPLPSLKDVPWEQLTSKQKKMRRHNNRKMKKQEYDRLKMEAKGAGVLEAGKVAQKKRGVVTVGRRDKVTSGRVEKAKVSGRQRLVEERKRAVMMGPGAGGRGGKGKRAKTKRKLRTGSKR